MNLRKLWPAVVLCALALSLLAAGFNSLTFRLRALGIYTDLRYPRAANRAIPWSEGPSGAPAGPMRRVPNIVVILADDLGINDVSAYGGWMSRLGVSTPNIDSIGRDGARFDQGYAGSAVCTVSRAALMTGRYPWRFGLEFTPTPGAMSRIIPALMAEEPQWHPAIVDKEKASRVGRYQELGLPPSEISVARLLKDRGYHTVHIGKWHLGGVPALMPNAHGFDESLNMESGLYIPEDDPQAVNSRQSFDPIDRFLWSNMRYAVSFNAGEWFEPRGYLTDYFTDEAVTVIHRNRNRPFFLYLAHWAVHTPLQASRAEYESTPQGADHRQRVYAAMVRGLDRGVGRVLQALKAEGLEQNTLVIFASDNGAPGYLGLPDVNRPYRGWKLTFFEGGLRVPFLAKWPERIPPGTISHEPVTAIDVLPTLVAAADARLPAQKNIDGVNLLPHLEHASQPLGPRALFWRDGTLQAVREGRWKLITAQNPKKDWLFDLGADPTERANLAQADPARLAALKTKLRAHAAEMPPPLWPSFLEFPIAIDRTLDAPARADDEYTYWIN